MPKNYRFYIVFLVLLVLSTSLIIVVFSMSKKVCIAEKCFKVEIADTLEKRAQGLMNRESIDKSKGMLFVFEKEDFYSFWMKNTLIPLDIIWIDKNKEAVHIERNVPPCKTEKCPSYKPRQKAMYVLEVNPNSGIKIGDKAKCRFLQKIRL